MRYKNPARFATVKLLSILQVLKEFKSGKRCVANASFCWNIGFGYHSRVEQDEKIEFYLMPFSIVTVTTFQLGAEQINTKES